MPPNPTDRPPLTPELEERRRDFQRAGEEARALVEGLSGTQLSWRPAPGAWSIAECLDHLRATAEEILKILDPAIERARTRGTTGEPPFRYGWLGPWFVRASGPRREGERRLSAPRMYRPRSHLPVDRVLPDFLELQDTLTERLYRANGLDLGRVQARSPVTFLLRIPLGQWFSVIAAHQFRHLEQARAVREHPGFPGS
ncbi:MAG TPA: DinB family protein [Longimicrobiaceae bacterium]|nr:DinB family protein [Longimicrobiaceae bacterium]